MAVKLLRIHLLSVNVGLLALSVLVLVRIGPVQSFPMLKSSFKPEIKDLTRTNKFLMDIKRVIRGKDMVRSNFMPLETTFTSFPLPQFAL